MAPVGAGDKGRFGMTKPTGTYEVRESRLYVNGEPAGIDRRVVGEVLRQYLTETGRAAAQFLPIRIAQRILALDRAIGLARLQAELHGA